MAHGQSSRFCQPSAPSLLTSSSSVSNQPSSSWIPQHELWLGTTFVWFTPLLECQSPLLNDFETFFEDFMPCLETQTRHKCSPLSYNIFAKDHTWQ